MANSASVGLFRRSTIRVRLILAFSSVALLLVLLAALGTWQLAELNRVADTSLQGQRLMGRWFAEAQGNVIRTLALARSDDPGIRQLLAPQLEAASQRTSALQKQVEGLLATPRSKALFAEIGERRRSYLEIRQRVLDARQAGRGEQALAMLDASLVPATNAYLASIEALLDFYGGAAGGESAAARAAATSGQALVVVVCIVAIVVGFVFSWKITAGIVGPVRFAAKLARRVAGGDLTTEVRTGGGDEIAQMLQALADMQSNLRTVVAEVTLGARTVTASSARLAAGNLDLSQRTEDQAATLEQTASAMEELTATVGRNADNARHASTLAAGASEVARQGGAVVGDVVSTMTDISGASRRIADIIGVIDGIAFQTNILALNAAVEAARAGEQGRGFAVVAAEVRSLAQRSAAAAREIKELIEASAGKVEAGTRLVDSAGRTMAQIVGSVQQVTDLVAQIAAASQEQSAGIMQVNASVARMERVVQQNAALVDEAASATEAMKGEASALLQTVSRFTLSDAVASRPHGQAPVAIRVQPVAPAAQLLQALAVRGTEKYAGKAGQKES